MNRCAFDILLSVLRPAVTRENTRLRDCIAPEKILALSLYRLAHGNSYESIGPVFNVGRSTVLEAVPDVVGGRSRASPNSAVHIKDSLP